MKYISSFGILCKNENAISCQSDIWEKGTLFIQEGEKGGHIGNHYLHLKSAKQLKKFMTTITLLLLALYHQDDTFLQKFVTLGKRKIVFFLFLQSSKSKKAPFVQILSFEIKCTYLCHHEVP